jgi:hypothetical protein
MTTLALLQKYLFPAWMHLLSASSSRLRWLAVAFSQACPS